MINNYYMYESRENCQKDIKIFNLHEDIILPKKFINNNSFIDYDKVNFNYSKNILKENIDIPKSWSWREYGNHKIELGGLRNQGKCDTSWAFALISALGDRYAIKYDISAPYLSILYFLIKSKPKNVKEGLCYLSGNTYLGSLWLENNYTILEICWPWKIVKDKNYTFPENIGELKKCCFNCCNDNDIDLINDTVFSCKKNSTNLIVNLTEKSNKDFITIDINKTIEAIQKDIKKYGPVISTFNLFEDFINYWEHDAKDQKIYIRKSNKQIGKHSVVITGWGIKDNIRFWEVRNNWGNGGDNGYFYIAFSQDTKKDKWCQIDIPSYKNRTFEGGVMTFLPGELKNIELFKKPVETMTTLPAKYNQTPTNYAYIKESDTENKAFSISEEKDQTYTKMPEIKKYIKEENQTQNNNQNENVKELSLDIRIDKKNDKKKFDNFIIQKIILYFCIIIIVILTIIIIVKVINKKYSNDIYKYFSYSNNNQVYSENFHHPIVLPY